MKLCILLVVCLFVTSSHCDITGEKPLSGTCLCLTGTNVNARESGSIDASVLTSVSKPECYKFHGGILTNDGYTWYQLQSVNGYNPWVVGIYLDIADASSCGGSSSGSSGSCSDSTAQSYACTLLDLADSGEITIWKQHPSGVEDNAFAYNNIKDTCGGKAASRSHYTCSECRDPGAPGGSVCLSTLLLQYIHRLYQHFGYIHINEIAGACHSCSSKHYAGRAVDVHNPSSQTSYMVSLCEDMGGYGLDEGNHVHCHFFE